MNGKLNNQKHRVRKINDDFLPCDSSSTDNLDLDVSRPTPLVAYFSSLL